MQRVNGETDQGWDWSQKSSASSKQNEDSDSAVAARLSALRSLVEQSLKIEAPDDETRILIMSHLAHPSSMVRGFIWEIMAEWVSGSFAQRLPDLCAKARRELEQEELIWAHQIHNTRT